MPLSPFLGWSLHDSRDANDAKGFEATHAGNVSDVIPGTVELGV